MSTDKTTPLDEFVKPKTNEEVLQRLSLELAGWDSMLDDARKKLKDEMTRLGIDYENL